MFSFLLAVIEINTHLVLCHFVYNTGDPKIVPKLLDFCQELAWKFIDNSNKSVHKEREMVEGSASIQNAHIFATAPHHAKYFNDQRWILGAKQ